MVRRVIFHWRARMSPSRSGIALLQGRIRCWEREPWTQMQRKGPVTAMRQVCRATQAEFVICEQAIDTNHGYAKHQVENSEVDKRRAVLERKRGLGPAAGTSGTRTSRAS